MASARLIYTELGENSNKFWNAQVVGSTVECEWGRVGDTTPQRKTFTLYSQDAAARDLEKRKREKLRKGYSEQRIVTEVAGPNNVGHLAKVQIQHNNDSETVALIDFLVQRNIHAIEGTTSIRLEKGKLTTPLGPVTLDGLIEAEALLSDMALYIAKAFTKGLPSQADFEAYTNKYLRIVPKDFGRKKIDPLTLFGSAKQLADELTLVESLKAVIKDAEQRSYTSGPPIFEAKLSLVEQGKQIDHINKLFCGSINRMHQSSSMRLKRVWQMHINKAADSFDQKIGNVKELWHGTKDANLLSILKNGFIIPGRSSSVAITGRMFGDGIYSSDQSTKALNYATSFWSGSGSTRCFMILNDIALGNMYRPTRSFSGLPPKGYDSCFAEAGKAGIRNNEYIVYRTNQIKPTYLCEFA